MCSRLEGDIQQRVSARDLEDLISDLLDELCAGVEALVHPMAEPHQAHLPSKACRPPSRNGAWNAEVVTRRSARSRDRNTAPSLDSAWSTLRYVHRCTRWRCGGVGERRVLVEAELLADPVRAIRACSVSGARVHPVPGVEDLGDDPDGAEESLGLIEPVGGRRHVVLWRPHAIGHRAHLVGRGHRQSALEIKFLHVGPLGRHVVVTASDAMAVRRQSAGAAPGSDEPALSVPCSFGGTAAYYGT
jgi:hypothetical protein